MRTDRVRTARSNPDSPEAAVSLALARLRDGEGPELLQDLSKGWDPLLAEAFQGLAGEITSLSAEGIERVMILVRLSSELRGGDEYAAARTLAACREDPVLVKGKRQRLRDIAEIGSRLSYDTVGLKLLRGQLSSLYRAQDLPRRGLARQIWLGVLRGGVPVSESMRMEEFDRCMARGRLALMKAYRYPWTLDDCHMRRYLSQFGFVARKADGTAYWRTDGRSARIVFSPEVEDRVASWWVAGPAPVPL